MKYQQLTEGQRYQISVLREDNLSCSEIGKRVGVSKSTVSREVKRNCTADCYSAAEAKRLSDTRRRATTKRFISPDTVLYV
ncbi:helix-turn-helix domain-containing protein [Salmonella enterica]|nr:helix-turn-helix domain-containing protein [Salmonella enterica]EJC0346200.1 helix-turn-helix domain-containing protein [Salmonella enterica]EJC0669454.1 helix-turn-helix domain-containing protein [Salmonella enterica]